MSKKSKHLEEFQEITRKTIVELDKKGITRHYEVHLNEPEQEELPQMLSISCREFYESKRELQEFTRGESESHGSAQYVDMKNIFSQKYEDENINHVVVVGSAGAGKSTLLARFARDAMNQKIPQMQDSEHMVHLINCHQFNANGRISVAQFLFKHMRFRPSEETTEAVFKWMIEHPQNLTFVIDSLDTLPYQLDKERTIVRRPNASAPPAAILYNLFVGNLFPGCKILSSSRHHTISKFEGDLRPDRIISLEGFSNDSIDSLVHGFLGKEKGQEVLDYFKNKCPALYVLGQIPVFLVFSLIGICGKMDEDGFTPKTVSGIMLNLLESLVRSPHADKFAPLDAIISKLKILSFNGMKDDRVFFSQEDFSAVTLDANEVTDLVVILPGRLDIETHIMEGESVMFFSHKSIQEFLAALYIAEMELDDFKSFIAGHIQEYNFLTVRKMLAGILLDPEVRQQAGKRFLEVKDADEKITSLKQSLRTQFERGLIRFELLELITTITEAGEGAKGIVPNDMTINLTNTPVTTADMHALARVMTYCDRVKELRLWDGHVSPNSLNLFEETLKQSTVKIATINIGENKNVEMQGFTSLGKVVRRNQVQNLDAADCCLKPQELQAFGDAMGDAKLNKLNLMGNWSMEKQGLESLGHIVRKNQVKELKIDCCELEPQEFQAFSNALEDAKLHFLDISNNTKMEEQGLSSLGHIVRRNQVQKLDVSNCKLKPHEIEAFSSALGGAKIRTLRIGGNSSSDARNIHEISKLVKNVSEEMDICDNELTSEDKRLLQEKLNQYPTDLKIKYGRRRQPKFLSSQQLSSTLRDQDLPDFAIIPIVTSKSTSKEIDSNGGTLEINDCVITFPPGAFLQKTMVVAKLEIDSSKWPKGYIGVTPMLYVNFDQTLQKPASVQMTSWCVDSKNTEVEILHSHDGDDSWKIIDHFPVKNEGKLMFNCLNFSPIWGAIKQALFGQQKFSIQGALYSKAKNSFTLIFHQTSEIIGDLDIKMQNQGRSLEIHLNKMPCEIGDEISTRFQFHPDSNQGFTFQQSANYSFLVDTSIFENSTYIMFNFSIVNAQAESTDLTIFCNVYKNNVIRGRDKHCFTYPWIGQNVQNDVAQAQPAPAIVNNIHGDIGTLNMGGNQE